MPDQTLPKTGLRSTAPGRVNLLGEHVDYNDGIVLPAAIDRAVRLSAEPLSEPVVHLNAIDLGKTVSFDFDSILERRDLDGKLLPDWALYPAGVAWAARQQGLPLRGMRAAYTSDVPIGAGLSSSAAVEVAFAALWRHLGEWQMDNLKLAQLCQQAENRYVGVNSGLMDQFASANGVAGHALYFDTRSLDWRPIPLPSDMVIIIADSGVRRSLANSAYNERRAACEQAVRLLQTAMPEIRSLRDVSPADFDRFAHLLPDVVEMRARHVVEEIARVDEAVRCLESGDAAGFGRLMLAGHASLRDLYQVSTPELDLLVGIAANLPGCYGARLTGAGFGGCTVNLVAEQLVEEFTQRLKSEYQRQAGRTAEVYHCRPSQGVQVVVNSE